MSYYLSRSAPYVIRQAVAGGVCFVVALYLVFGPGAVHAVASRVASRASGVVSHWLHSSRLSAIEQQVAADQQGLVEALACRKVLLSQIQQLVELRNDAIARRGALRDRLAPDLAGLRASLTAGFVGPPSSDQGRVLALLARRDNLQREIESAEGTLQRLVAGLEDLDQRILQVRNRLDAQQRESRLQRHSLEAETSRRALLDRLQTLESHNGVR